MKLVTGSEFETKGDVRLLFALSPKVKLKH